MVTSLRDRQLARVVDQYTTAAVEAESRLSAAVVAAYAGVDWYDPAQTMQAAATAANRATVGTATLTGMTQRWATMVLDLLGVKPAPVTVGKNVGRYPRTAEPFEVYSRPVFIYRDAVAYGAEFQAAHAAAMRQVETLVATDMTLAAREAERDTYEAANVTHYRRVIRPELSASGTCGLCVAASQMIYKIEDLLPIHSRCKCRTLPVVGDDDPARLLNTEDLNRVYNTAGGTSPRDLKRTRYQVTADGELGPTLVPHRRVTDATRSGRSTRRHVAEGWDSPQRIRAELAALEPVLARLESRAAAGENVAAALGYQSDRIATLRRKLAA